MKSKSLLDSLVDESKYEETMPPKISQSHTSLISQTQIFELDDKSIVTQSIKTPQFD